MSWLYSEDTATLGPFWIFFFASTDPAYIGAHTDLRRKFRRDGRTPSGNLQRAMTGDSHLTNGSGPNERSPLINSITNGVHNIGEHVHNVTSKHLWEDDRAWVRYPAQFWHLTWLTLTNNYVNVLLVFVPVGIVLGALGMDPTAVFVINFLAIVPLASLLGFATEELSVKLGDTVGGLLNATFGNAVELIVCL